MNDDNRITYFGVTDSRNQQVKFGIRTEDRSKHMYAIGKTGMGKSTLLENMAIQDIQNGEGLAFLDPHGKTVDLLLEHVPEHRIKDVIYVAPFDLENPIAFNVLEDTADGVTDPVRKQLIVSGLMSTFKKIWVDAFSARMEYILNYTLLALLEIPDATLLDVNRMLADKQFRNSVIKQLKEPVVRSYWEKEFAGYTEKTVAEAVPAIQNKVGQFISNSLIRNILGQKKSSFDLRKAMDEKKIILFNLSIGRIGEDAVNLLGSLFVTKIYLAAMSRANIPDKEMKTVPHFYLYVDEFQNFTNDSFAQILAQSRKYKLNLVVAHQYVKQMTEIVRDAIFGNVGTMVAFRVGADDAESLEKEFQPTFVVEDFVNLGRFQMYLKLMIDGVTSPAFSARGLGVWPMPKENFVERILESSRKLYTHPRSEVEDHILSWSLGTGSGAYSQAGQGQAEPKSQPRNEQTSREPHRDSNRELSREPRRDQPRQTERPHADRPHTERSHTPQVPQAPRREPVAYQPDHADVPRYIDVQRDVSRQSLQQPSVHRERERPQQPERRTERPASQPPRREPVAYQPAPKVAVHNPFAVAFKESGVTQEVSSTPAPERVQPPQPQHPQHSAPESDAKAELKKAVEMIKQVDEDTLRNVLGV